MLPMSQAWFQASLADVHLEGARETVAQAQKVAVDPDFRAEAIHINVSDEESVKAAVARVAHWLGRIDYAVHSAGIPGGRGAFDPIAEASFVDFKHLLDINVYGTFLVDKYVSAAVKTQELQQACPTDPVRDTTRGVIVNLASVSSFMAVSNMVQYTTCKHAIIGITKTADGSPGQRPSRYPSQLYQSDLDRHPNDPAGN
ncbi:hypothetical protein SLS53_001636 [Cytospora paraplurivora]|uniref:Uncharacterized protein n=1 Tax=Cytospora paraplurivora TaxID=2898453 RepID=A0AAN9UGN9_9PEZI